MVVSKLVKNLRYVENRYQWSGKGETLCYFNPSRQSNDLKRDSRMGIATWRFRSKTL